MVMKGWLAGSSQAWEGILWKLRKGHAYKYIHSKGKRNGAKERWIERERENGVLFLNTPRLMLFLDEPLNVMAEWQGDMSQGIKSVSFCSTNKNIAWFMNLNELLLKNGDLQTAIMVAQPMHWFTATSIKGKVKKEIGMDSIDIYFLALGDPEQLFKDFQNEQQICPLQWNLWLREFKSTRMEG